MISAMTATDTTPEAAALQLQLYRQAGPSRRATIAAELSDTVRSCAIEGIRRRHPEYSEREVADAFIRAIYGIGRGCTVSS